MPSLKLPTSLVNRWVKGTRALLPFTSPISITRGRDKVLDRLLIFTPDTDGPSGSPQSDVPSQQAAKPPLASLLQLHYPLSSPDTGLLAGYTLWPPCNEGTLDGSSSNGVSSSTTSEGSSGEGRGCVRYNEDLLIEDMDMFAADVACLHVGGLSDKRLVTASLGSLEMHQHTHPVTWPLAHTQGADENEAGGLQATLRTSCDLELSGQVVWVGRSSMEVLLELSTAAPKSLVSPDSNGPSSSNSSSTYVDQQNGVQNGPASVPRQLVSRAQFLMAARTPDLMRAMPIQPLQLTTDVEESLFREAQERADRKKQQAQQAKQANGQGNGQQGTDLSPDAPLTREQEQSCSSSGREGVAMSSTHRSRRVVTQFEDRNTTNSVFGGQLLVYGTTIALDVANTHAGQPCHLLGLHDVAFQSLAPLDCELQLQGHVAFVEGQQIHVRALVRRSQEDGAALVTTFWCTYTPIDKTAVVTPVHPATQAELQDWQQARGYARQNEQTVRQMESA